MYCLHLFVIVLLDCCILFITGLFWDCHIIEQLSKFMPTLFCVWVREVYRLNETNCVLPLI